MPNWTLVVPLLDDDPRYARGVEFGLLYAKMTEDCPSGVEGYFLRANQEQITLLANRLGWRVEEMRPHDKDWFWCRLEPTEDGHAY